VKEGRSEGGKEGRRREKREREKRLIKGEIFKKKRQN
jgi:hypothetical protein